MKKNKRRGIIRYIVVLTVALALVLTGFGSMRTERVDAALNDVTITVGASKGTTPYPDDTIEITTTLTHNYRECPPAVELCATSWHSSNPNSPLTNRITTYTRGKKLYQICHSNDGQQRPYVLSGF